MMEYLPNGTSLTNVRIPSYDENLQPTSLLMADEITIVDKDAGIMNARETEIKVFSEEPYTVKLKKAQFHYYRYYLESNENVMINNSQLALTGSGTCYDLKTKELFIKGPAKAIIATKELAQRLCLGVTSAMAMLPAQAAPPAAPTLEQLNQLEEVRTVKDERIAQESNVISEEKARLEQAAAASDDKVTKFLTAAGEEDLLVKNEPKSEKEKLIAQSGALTVTCDDGMYYDAESGHMVCLKNVVVNDPRFRLTCRDQLKIFLVPKGEKGAKKDESTGFGSTEVKELIATGDVKITYRNAGDKKDIIATGESAHYEVETGEMLIEGGLPTVQQGQNFFEALEPTVWVKLSKKGFLTGPGKKRTVYLQEEE